MVSLWSVVQKEGESLWSYIKRFTLAYTNVKDLSDSLAIQIFTTGLSNDHVRYPLIHKNVSTMHELVAHAYKFVKADEMKDHH